MSLSQTAEFGFRFPKLGARVALAREKGSEVGGNLALTSLRAFFMCLLILQLCT